LDIINLVND